MQSNTDQTHKISIFLVDNIVSSLKENRQLVSKNTLLAILKNHPETIEYLSYIENIILVDCRDRDIITKDSEGNLKFPIKRDGTGEITKYHYII